MTTTAARLNDHHLLQVGTNTFSLDSDRCSTRMLHDMPATFMDLPPEVRLEVYAFYVLCARCLTNRRQPSNHHFRLFRVCREIAAEAESIVFTYVSLLHERQIRAFIDKVPDSIASCIVYADVANDGRVVTSRDQRSSAVPLSQLHIALRRMPALKHLRVFECQQGLQVPTQPYSKHDKRFMLQFEDAMFPIGRPPSLQSYELYLSSSTQVTALKKLDASRLQRLRLSGNCGIAPKIKAIAIRELALEGVTGNYFDRRTLDEWCDSPVLATFVYALEDRIGFEIRDEHIQSLAHGSGRRLRKLVLLGCSRLTSTVLADCLRQLDSLEYLALSIVTVEEQRTNIIPALSSSLHTFKFSVTNAWYALPLIERERAMCDTIEERLRRGDLQLKLLAVHLRLSIMDGGRRERWEQLASELKCTLRIGPWETEGSELL